MANHPLVLKPHFCFKKFQLKNIIGFTADDVNITQIKPTISLLQPGGQDSAEPFPPLQVPVDLRGLYVSHKAAQEKHFPKVFTAIRKLGNSIIIFKWRE